jgi:two-component system response regulator HydG
MSETLHILIVDDDYSMAKTLADILRYQGYEAELAHSGAEALEKVTQTSFDCVLSDIKMPDVNGVAMYKSIKVVQPDLPVVLMTAYSDDNLVQEGLAEGVIAVLTKPLDIDLTLNFLTHLREKRSIVVVDDNPHFCQTLEIALQAQGFTVLSITDPQGVVEKMNTDELVVLLDLKLNGTNGLMVFKEIRTQYPHLPVILITGYQEEMAAMIETALRIGAYTFAILNPNLSPEIGADARPALG